MNEMPLALFSGLPEYRSPAWLNSVPRELVKDRSINTWELFHPVPIARVPGWENIATRVWANLLTIEAHYNEELASLIQTHGHMPENSDQFGCLGEMFFDAYKGIAFFAGFSNEQNFFRSCWVSSLHAIFIEEVGSKFNGKIGGWGLTKALIGKLLPFAKERQKPIHVAAVSHESEAVFLHYGFSKVDLRLRQKPHSFRSDLILRP